MKWIFNKIFISQNLVLFYSYIGVILFLIFLSIIFIIKEIRSQNAS